MITETQGQEVYVKLKQINNFAKELGINILDITVNASFIAEENSFTANVDFLVN